MAKGSTLVIGFDNISPRIKLLKSSTGQANPASVDYISYSETLFGCGRECDVLKECMAEIKSQSSGFDNIFIVLPDYCFAIDTVSIPNLSRFKVQSALKVESEGSYKNYKDLTVKYFPLSSSRSYSTYGAIVVQNALINDIKKLFSNEKLPLKEITFSANAHLNSAFVFSSKNRGKSFLFVDVRKDETLISMSAKGHTSGFANLPFGYSLMDREEVVNEQTIWNHDVAELAVINAQELAKAKKLTVAAVEEDDTVLDENENESPAPFEIKPDNSEEYGFTPEEIEQQRIEEEHQKQNLASKVKVFTRKAPKKLPKFMQRPEPETREEMIQENFRSILKRILLYVEYNKQDKNLNNFEYVVLKLPQKYEFLIEKLNEEAENNVLFKSFKLENSDDINDCLELVGALYSKSYNSDNIF